MIHKTDIAAPISGCSWVSGTGSALVNGKRYGLKRGTLMLIERGDKHEIKNTGRAVLRTLNFYVPPAYDKDGDELPAARR